MKDFLQIQNLTKAYDQDTILNDITLSVEQGEFIVLLGPSGCGKSTLLNCITGLIPFNEGIISINGKKMNDISPANRNLAMVFQSYALYPNMNVRKNISFGMEIRKVAKTTIDEKVEQVAELLKIHKHLKKKPAQLSGGQRQRVAIARALVRKPDIFLFDEPLSNLDAKLRVNMRTELKKLHKKLAATIIYVTHDQIEALTLASRIAIMVSGKIIQFGTPDEIYHNPTNMFVAKFIGTPVINVLPATLQRSKASWELAITPHQSNEASIPYGKRENSGSTHETKGRQNLDNVPKKVGKAVLPPLLLPVPPYFEKHSEELEMLYKKHGGKVLLGIRPEAMVYQTQLPSEAVSVPIEAEIDVIVPSGSDTFIVCTVLGHELTARSHSRVKLPSNGTISLDMDLNHALLFNPQTEKRIV